MFHIWFPVFIKKYELIRSRNTFAEFCWRFNLYIWLSKYLIFCVIVTFNSIFLYWAWMWSITLYKKQTMTVWYGCCFWVIQYRIYPYPKPILTIYVFGRIQRLPSVDCCRFNYLMSLWKRPLANLYMRPRFLFMFVSCKNNFSNKRFF